LIFVTVPFIAAVPAHRALVPLPLPLPLPLLLPMLLRVRVRYLGFFTS